MLEAKIVRYDEYTQEINSVRYDVFVQEQGVPLELELDGLDDKADHVLVWDGNTAIGTGRLLRDGHIGRVCVKITHRKKGVGKLIMESLLEKAVANRLSKVRLSAQCHAKGFYRDLGFTETGDVFKDAGIDHIAMKKKL